jgi:eukaryotic translation initiation factor 2C
VPVAYYADIIATKCRDLVYSEISTDGGAPSVSSASDQPTNMTYDPLLLTKRIEGAADCELPLQCHDMFRHGNMECCLKSWH